ncbi:hypothetical protein DMB38_14255 [Streptomyces sp. WAC 06738]|uniref:hypothetical protein n=1 Tax=Streptomyces sp. WAC 06738 TaxID=2203210 RepID=UPI000F713BD9|nr:hypothetical protein [Streptomyces sp. WAC 06738]AZM46814.1 hypothetical protein DMB38_14255 [Streptomyces sp. WAC 06738]
MSSSSIRRGTLAATALALSLAALTACGAGNNAETLKINPDNARVTAGSIKIQNAVVITPADEADGPAAVSARIFNNGDRDQTLERLTLADGGQELELSGANGRGDVVVPAGGSVMLGGEGHASAVLPDGHDAGHGATKKLAFEFSREGEVRLAAFIVADDGEYAPWAATPTPTPTPTPVETGTSSPDAEPGEDAGTGTGTDATDGAEGGAEGADATDGASPDADATENAGQGTDAAEGATSSESPVTEQ